MISLLVVSYNNLKYTTLCLQSLKVQTDQDFEVVVVENGSRKEERAVGHEFKSVILNKNYGFPFAVNLGVKACQNDWVLVLNNDCILQENFIEEMIKAVKNNPEINVFSPKIYQQERSKEKEDIDSGFRRNDREGDKKNDEVFGQTQRSVPTTNKNNPILYSCGDDIDEKGLARNIGRGEIDRGQYDLQKTVPLATFACILIKKEVLEKFPLEESFFGYYEDVDFCLRIKKAGLQIGFVAKAICSHIGEASFKKLDNLDNEMRQFRNLSFTVIRNFPVSHIVRHYFIFNLKSVRYYLLIKKRLEFILIEVKIFIRFITRIIAVIDYD